MHPADLTVAQAGAGMRAGTLTATALTQAHLARIAERDGHIRAFVLVDADGALAAAALADAALAAGRDPGPLLGISFAVKDIIDVAGLPTLCGAAGRRGAAPADRDAEAVARLRAGGAVCLGKLATYEYAMVGPTWDGPQPPALNPWRADRITGGSSSGSAAAVAAGMVRLALGTDTGGSIRSPAAYCGVVGLKPRHGLVPMDGIQPLAPSLDHVGPVAATAAEAAAALAVLTGRPCDSGGGVTGLRLGIARDWVAADPQADPRVTAGLDAAAQALERLGAVVTPAMLPDYAVMEAAGAILLHAEELQVHAAFIAGTGSGMGRGAWRSLLSGLALTPGDVADARAARSRLTSLTDAALAPLDAILTATTLTPAPDLAPFAAGRAVWTPMRTLPFNLTGHPALSVPVGLADGLPLAAQIVGRDEGMLCRIGAALRPLAPPLPVWPFAGDAGKR